MIHLLRHAPHSFVEASCRSALLGIVLDLVESLGGDYGVPDGYESEVYLAEDVKRRPLATLAPGQLDFRPEPTTSAISQSRTDDRDPGSVVYGTGESCEREPVDKAGCPVEEGRVVRFAAVFGWIAKGFEEALGPGRQSSLE